jgi:uncharacterized protein (DUF433 family)
MPPPQDVGATDSLVEIASFGDLSRLIDGDGTIRGSGVEAHRIAALVAGGMELAEILEDYPNLGPDQVEAASRYALVVPNPGRPYPDRTAKSVLRRGGGGGLAAAFHAARHSNGGEDAA